MTRTTHRRLSRRSILVAVTVTGTEPALYEILIDPQGENTYSSFIMYIDTREVTVTVNDVMVDSGDGSLISGI